MLDAVLGRGGNRKTGRRQRRPTRTLTHEHRNRFELERRTDVVHQSRQRIVGRDEVRGRARQCGNLSARSLRLPIQPCGAIHEGRDRQHDGDEEDQREQILTVAHGDSPVGSDEEQVRYREPDDAGDRADEHAAQGRHRDRQRQEREQHGRQFDVTAERQQQRHERRSTDDQHHPRHYATVMGQGRTRPAIRDPRLWTRSGRDDVDVEWAGDAQHSTDDRAIGELLPPTALRCAEYQLRAPLGAREVDECRRDVVAHHLVVGTAELLQQLALRREMVVVSARAQDRRRRRHAHREARPSCESPCGPRGECSASPLGAPVIATTTRSRVSHVAATP